MKKVLRISIFSALLISVLSFASCLKDEESYSLGKYWISYGIIEGDQEAFTIKLDNGKTLNIAQNNDPGFKVSDGLRVVVNYTILQDNAEGYLVRLNAIDNLLTKKPVYKSSITEQALKDSIGVDPINIDDLWFSSGKYLNINFEIFRNDPQLAHFINLVVDDSAPKTPGTVTVEFRHNAYKDSKKHSGYGRVSFDIESLIPQGEDQIKVIVKWTNYYGKERSESGTFKRNPTEIPSAKMERALEGVNSRAVVE